MENTVRKDVVTVSQGCLVSHDAPETTHKVDSAPLIHPAVTVATVSVSKFSSGSSRRNMCLGLVNDWSLCRVGY